MVAKAQSPMTESGPRLGYGSAQTRRSASSKRERVERLERLDLRRAHGGDSPFKRGSVALVLDPRVVGLMPRARLAEVGAATAVLIEIDTGAAQVRLRFLHQRERWAAVAGIAVSIEQSAPSCFVDHRGLPVWAGLR
jgi:hypothetical protein